MKSTAKQYAISLYHATTDISKDEIKKYLDNFIKILQTNHDFKKINQIIKDYEIYQKKQNQIVPVELITAQKITNQTRTKIISYLQTKLFPEASHLEIQEKIDKNLIGGIIIKSGDMVMDGSLARKLESLKKSLVN